MRMGSDVTQGQSHWVPNDVPWQTPEDRERKGKEAELASLLRKLTQMETEFMTIQSELSAFEFKYHRIVGRRYAELDFLGKHLAECGLPLLHTEGILPGKTVVPKIEQEWRRRFRFLAKQDPAVHVRPSEPLKKLFREVAKRIHPDLGLDENDRMKRQSLMAEANEAYRSGDGRKLRAILLHWQVSPESVAGDGPGVELVRVIRRVDQVRRRIRFLARKMEALRRSKLYRLKTLIEENENRGRDLMRQMAAILDEQIAKSRACLRLFARTQTDG
jgi:hypothetical protein